MESKIKEEIKKIEIPNKLSCASKKGILKAAKELKG
jgi:hypothetical protein